MQIQQNITENVNRINKSDLAELKALKAPPASVELVAEATCVFFNKAQNFNSFRQLMSSGDFTSTMKTYDLNSVSDYTLDSLRKYVDDPRFNPDYIYKISSASSYIARWILNVYNYASLLSSVKVLLFYKSL